MLYPSLLLGLGALLWLRLRACGGLFNALLLLCLLVGLWLSGFYLVADHFTGHGIDDAVLFHVSAVFDISVLQRFWLIVLTFLLLLGASVWLLLSIRSLSARHPSGWLTWVGLFAAIAGLCFHPAMADIGFLLRERYQNHGPDLLSVELEVQTEAATPRAPRSFVYLYLESLDQVFLDEARYPGLMPQLKALMTEGSHIQGLRQAPLTGWTIAGMVSSQCGLPLARAATTAQARLRANGKVVCVGDILQEHGYALSFMGGAQLTFAGKGSFYRLHGFADVFGGPELDVLAGRDLPRSIWGVYDDDLLALALMRIEKLASRHELFGLVLLTLDTHPPHGHETPACKGVRYGSGESSILNAVHCTDRLVSDFIREFRRSEYTKDVALIISSDHLMMANDNGVQTDVTSRRNSFFFFNPAGEFPSSVERVATMFDVAPTLLNLIGFDVESLGFGRNIYGKRETLAEKYGFSEFSRLIYVWRNALQERWAVKADRQPSF